MNLYINPSVLPERGLSTVIPRTLKQDLIDWTTAEYKTYKFGTLLQQKYRNSLFCIYQYIANINQPSCIHLQCNEACVILQFTLDGYASYEDHASTSYSFEPQTGTLFYLPSGIHKINFNPGKFRCIQIEFKAQLLKELAEDIPEIKEVLEDLLKNDITFEHLNTIQLNFIILENIQKLLKLPLQSGLLNIGIKSIILSLINQFYQQVLVNEEEINYLPQSLHRGKIVHIRNYIMAKPHLQECKLSNLSKIYYLNRKTISQHFHQLFGMHISDFLLQQILEKAIYLLLNTDMPIKDIAEELGYSTSSNFARAFIDYYHQSPFDVRINRGLFQC